MNVKRAITDLLLAGNAGKMNALAKAADEFMFVAECYTRHLIGLAVHPAGWGGEPVGRHAFHPKQPVLPPLATPLSERYKRCAWMQACGVVNSWLSNGRHKDGSSEPSFERVAMQANANVVLLSRAKAKDTRAHRVAMARGKPLPAETKRQAQVARAKRDTETDFGWWMRVSTLEKNKPVYIPFDMHPYGERLLSRALASGGKMSTGVLLCCKDSVWSAQVCVEEKVQARKWQGKRKRGHDVGQRKILSSANGRDYGTLSEALTRRVARDTEQRSRKQRLNACLKLKGLEPVPLAFPATNRWVRNAAGRAINLLVGDLQAEPETPLSILEALSAGDMRAKSRLGNRLLKAGQIGYIASQTRRALDLAGLPWAEINPAYTSQECLLCGFVLRENRLTQARFACLMCGHTENADTHGAKVIERRHGDDEVNSVGFREAGTILRERYMRRWSGERPPPAPTSPSGSLVGDLPRRLALPFHNRGSPSNTLESPSQCTQSH